MLLREVLGTLYLTDEYAGDVEFLISRSVKAIETKQPYLADIYATRVRDAINECCSTGMLDIDLNDCRFTGKVWAELVKLKRHKNIVRLYDSGDQQRNKYLAEFMGFEYPYANMKHVRGLGQKPTDLKSMSRWVSELDKNVIYELYDEEYTKHPYFLMAINFFDPEVKMVIDNRAFIDYAKVKFGDYMLNECKKFYYIYRSHSEYLETEVIDGKVNVVNIGDYDVATFVRKFPCMPWFIGNERLSLTNTSALLQQAVRSVLEDVAVYLRERPTTIETFFPFKEEYV